MAEYKYIKVNLPNKKVSESAWVEKTYDKFLRPWFPYEEPRPSQKEALVIAYDWLYKQDKDVVVLQAPTGFGKSVFAYNLTMVEEQESYYTSPQLNLIEQVAREFGMPMVKGKQNFICPTTSKLASEAPCNRPKFKCEIYCDYKRQRDEGAASTHTAITPAFLLRVQQNEASKFLRRDVAVVDEAHNLPSYITDILKVTITTRELDNLGFLPKAKFPEKVDFKTWELLLKPIYLTTVRQYEKIKTEIVTQGLSYDEDALERLRKFNDKVQFVLSLLMDKRSNCVVETDVRGRGTNQYRVAIFKMVRAAPVAENLLQRMAEKHIFMSATILHGKQFLRELGLEKRDALFIDITESPIQSTKNGPVVIHDAAWLSRKRYKDGIHDAVKAIASIITEYPKDKVVIIPASHNLRADIVFGLEQRGYGKRITTHGAENKQISCPSCKANNPFRGEDFIECPKCNFNYHIFERDQAIASFYATTDPKVMVSTYLREGADLKDDLCRCLIIPKIPYPNLGDNLVKARMAYDEEDYVRRTSGNCGFDGRKGGGPCREWSCSQPCQLWYRMETVKTLVQAAGRIIRSETDWGSIHILDKSWNNFLSNNRRIIPKWFLNCVVEGEGWNAKRKTR